MFIMARHRPERRPNTMVLSIRELLPISTGRRAGLSRETGETLVQNKSTEIV